MKISIDSVDIKDGYYLVGSDGRLCQVFVDGVEVKSYKADTEEGWADIYVLDADGNSYYDEKTFEVPKKRIYGKITIKWRPL